MNIKYLIAIVLFLALSGGGAVVYQKIRGIRNNNPGNIRLGEKWQGMSNTQTDGAFIQFDDVAYGIRAINRVLRTYKNKHGIDTIRRLINRWAPPVENETESYVFAVASDVGVQQNERIDIETYAPAITKAIIKHENGINPYADNIIQKGVALGWA